MKLYQSCFHTVNFKDLDLIFNDYFFKKVDSKFWDKFYEKWHSTGARINDEKNFLEAKRKSAFTIHDIICDKRKILSFGIGTGIVENELIKIDSHYEIDGVDHARDPRWENKIVHKYSLKHCCGNQYEVILLNSVIYNFSDDDLIKLLSESDQLLSKDGIIIVWEQDLPSITRLFKIKLKELYLFIKNSLSKKDLFVFWGELRSPVKIKKIFEAFFEHNFSSYFLVDENLINHEVGNMYRSFGYKLFENNYYLPNSSQIHVFQKLR